MNGFEICRIYNKMIDNVRIISIETELYYLLDGLTIDKNSQ